VLMMGSDVFSGFGEGDGGERSGAHEVKTKCIASLFTIR